MKKILVIDSDVGSWQSLRELFEANDFEVFFATEGYEGLRLAFESIPDVICCDLILGDVSGREVLARLRENSLTDIIPVLVLIARGDNSVLRQLMLAGADDVLTKPVDGQELLDAVVALSQKKARYDRHSLELLDRLREGIASSLPHELNTALNGILGSTDLLLMMLGSLSRSDEKELLEVIHNSAQRLHQMTENFWLYTRLSMKGRQASDLSASWGLQADARQSIVTVCQSEAKRLGRPGDLRVRVDEAPLAISETDLHKLLAEIVNNAFKFSGSGTPVEVEGVVEGERYRLTVRDHGRGMTEEQSNNIGAFVQFDRSRYEQQGLGLGLAIVKRLVEIYRGEIIISSGGLGQGTCVTVFLPRVVQIV